MKKTTIYLLALALAGILGSVGLASAFGFGFFDGQNRTAIERAINDNDFGAWKTAMTETLTQENFNRIVERRSMASNRTAQMSVMKAIKSGNYTAYIDAVDNTIKSGNAMTEEEFNAAVARFNTTDGVNASWKGFGHKRWFARHGMHW